jgi:PKD repeat protein
LNEQVTDELIIFVNPMPAANAGLDGIACETEDYQLADANISFAQEAVLWEVIEGNGIIGEPSVLNTYYHPVMQDAGTTVKLRLTAFGVDACSLKQISDEMLIQIAPLPVLFAGNDNVICMTGNHLISDATALHYSSLSWSTTDGLGTFNPPDQLITTFTPDPLQGGSTIEIVLTAFGTGDCLGEEVSSLPAHLVVDSVPSIYPGNDITTCLSAGPVEVIGVSLNNYTSFWWMIHNGQGFGQLTNENSLSPVYLPDPRDTELIDGVKLRLSATGAGQCIAEVFDGIMTIHVDSLPTVFSGADAAICMNELSYKILDANIKYAANPQWTTLNGSGTFSPPDALITTYTAGGADAGKIIELKITVSGTGNCDDNFANDALFLKVDSLPMAFAGFNDTTCINSPYFLGNAKSTNSSSVKWEVITGNGYFSDVLLLNPSYIPGPGDESTTVELKLTAFGAGMCSSELHESTVSVYVVPLPEVNAGNDDAICETETEIVITGATVNNSNNSFWTKTGGNGVFLNANTLTPMYQPAPNDVGQTITFNLNAIGLGKCNDTTIIDSRTLKIGKKPEVRFFIIEDSISCAFSPTWFTDFSYTYFNEEIISRTWDFGDGPPITVSPATVIVSHKYNTPGNKVVTLTINIAIDGIPLPACENSMTKIIEVSPLPVVQFNYTQSNYCNGEVYFEDKSESNIEIVHWDFGDDQHAHENPIIHTFETPGDKIIMLIVQDQNGCQDTLTETINVKEFFNFNILFEYAGICNEYKFWADNILPSGNSIQDYFWTFGDGSNAVNQDTARHEFSSPGQYDLVLKAIDSSGCLRIKDYIIDIPECPDNIAGQLFIPNAFDPEEVTPSNPVSPDSEFRIFLPKGQNITEYQIEIYDLWGNLLWQSTILHDGSPHEFWDGKYKNELVPAGPYLWKAYAKFDNVIWPGQAVNFDPNGKKFTSGIVTVIR